MNIRIIAVGKLKESFWREAEAEYLKRLSRYARFSVVELRDDSLREGAEEQTRKAEGERILAALRPKEYVIALDLGGKTYTSEEYATHLGDLMNTGVPDLAFVIGGSVGLDRAVLDRADEKLSFSRFTFSHQIMRPILLEQVYRAFKILRGETYHK